MHLTLSAGNLGPVLDRLAQANQAFELRSPSEAARRQPVHVVYGGAQRFRADTAPKLGNIAREMMRNSIPDAHTLASITGMEEPLAQLVHARVAAKLEREPVEDFRIDFEDGYGIHTDGDEDSHAVQAAEELARGMARGTLPPSIGIRIKPLSGALSQRAVRTLDLFVTRLLETTAELPPNFVITLPKVTIPAQVEALHHILLDIETRFQLPARSTGVEIMIEAPQSLVDERGVCAIPAVLAASGGRCRGLHFGPYDYTTAVGISGSAQSLHHPACDFARHVMQTATAGTGVFLSDGPTKTIPKQGSRPEEIHRAMRVHYDDVRRSLRHGFYQGWDLHPAQFPMRYAAVYAFFLESLGPASTRLRNFMDAAAQATTTGTVFDDAASAQGLLNFFLQGLGCGALEESELATTGITLEQLRQRSFARIIEARRP